jgi:hypothetical protein
MYGKIAKCANGEYNLKKNFVQLRGYKNKNHKVHKVTQSKYKKNFVPLRALRGYKIKNHKVA